MKNSRYAILAALFTFFAFASITYTSCKKDPCAVYSCQNNGTCSDGKCVCPSGYVGVHCENLAPSMVILRNNAKLPVTIQINDTSKTIPAGESMPFYGEWGIDYYANAYIAAVNYNGQSYGTYVTMDFDVFFPQGGSMTQDINVPSQYFFLQVINTSGITITSANINQSAGNSSYDYGLNITAGNSPYELGYYAAYSNSTVVLYSPAQTWTYNNLNLQFTPNQVVTLTTY
ncbi:MAG: calcium-binding EGF-like domain-containing protein [Flavipsychrobacter sp.]|nr:calcium-binding EGF-like domain-containing protein [Flavipsychrobacter sp.]